MLNVNSYKYLFTLKYNLNSWIESEPLRKLIRPTVIKFLEKEIFSKYRIFILLIVDKKPKNRKLLTILIEKYRINKVIVFVYYF